MARCRATSGEMHICAHIQTSFSPSLTNQTCST